MTLRSDLLGWLKVWSDTLSKFASIVNLLIQRYNDLSFDDSRNDRGFKPLLSVTYFVPADLAPEMNSCGNITGAEGS